MHSNCYGSVKRFFSLALFVAGIASVSFSQNTPSQAIGLPVNGAFSGSDFDLVQLNNGDLHIELPLYSESGRGLSTEFKYVYDNKGWYEYTLNSLQGTPVYVRPIGWVNNLEGPT